MTTYDTLIFADLRTMDPTNPTASAVGIQDGFVEWVGDRDEAQKVSATHTLDYGANVILPGFVDAHIHPILGAEFTRGVDLTGVTSFQELEVALTSVGNDSDGEAGECILGWVLDPTVIPERNISADDIDNAVADRPVFIRLFDAHSAVVNTRAIHVAGLTGDEIFASSAEVETSGQGRPTGFLKEWEAMEMVIKVIPPLPFDKRLKLFLDVLNTMADEGITGGQVLDRTDGMFDLVKAAEREGDLPIRLTFSPWIMPGDEEQIIEEIIAMQGIAGDRWNVDGVKLMIDGTIDNGTAWLASPDVNQQ